MIEIKKPGDVASELHSCDNEDCCCQNQFAAVAFRKSGKEIRDAALKKVGVLEKVQSELAEKVKPLLTKYDLSLEQLTVSGPVIIPVGPPPQNWHPHQYPSPLATIHVNHTGTAVAAAIARRFDKEVAEASRDAAEIQKVINEINVNKTLIAELKIFTHVKEDREYSLVAFEVAKIFS